MVNRCVNKECVGQITLGAPGYVYPDMCAIRVRIEYSIGYE